MFRSLFLLLAAAVILPAFGISAHSYADGLSKAGNKHPLVIFCFVANGDKYNAKKYDEFIKQHKIDPYVRKSVFLVLPVYQYPDEKQQKQQDRVMGTQKLPGGVWSYPCLAVVDGNNNLRGIVQSAAEMKDVEKAGRAVSRLIDEFKEQETLLGKANRASGSRKAELLMAASDMELNMPSDAVSNVKKNARRGLKDKVGLENRMNFDIMKVVEDLQPLPFAEANLYIRRLIDRGGLSRRQRQEIMAAYAGHLRRNNASAELLRAAYTEMRNIDPHSVYAAYAEGALAIWVQKNEKLTTVSIPVEIDRKANVIVDADTEVNRGSLSTDEPVKPTIGKMTALGSTENPADVKEDTPAEQPADDSADDSDFEGGEEEPGEEEPAEEAEESTEGEDASTEGDTEPNDAPTDTEEGEESA